ncbi:hypothetical protein CQW23_21352 [Capsicum baccatum]|uniref:non-specific serine/threonine protein kinase n=1 Tax=Capsicum baccatum TaxID=33114 RepID=A0A2G2VXU3_CAPBA|nr:hypothetical protein CQW23_21352 [Capsicum baccatum]
MGYAAPEYVQTGRLTSKSDVWSYGVFLYEMITGRRPLDRNHPRSEQKLLEWVKPYISDSKKFQQILDPRLDSKISRSAQKLSIVANRCLVRHPKSRPKMSEVLGHKEWVTEVNVLGVAEHRNLVKLVGYCAEDDERGIQRLLVYEYMPNRSVENRLSARSETPLSWAMRLKIAQDAARGLTYLHEEMDVQIIFRDFKSSNILLDEQWNAKLSDFGLARLGPPDGLTHVSTAVQIHNFQTSSSSSISAVRVPACTGTDISHGLACGPSGSWAPCSIPVQQIEALHYDAIHIYGFKMTNLRIHHGCSPIAYHLSIMLDRNHPRSEQKLLEWVKPYISDSKKFQQILDSRLDDKISRSTQKLSIVTNRCLVRHLKSRSKMSEQSCRDINKNRKS